MNKIHQIKVLKDIDIDSNDFTHPFYEELTFIIGEENLKFIGFNNDDYMFVRLSDFRLKQILTLMNKYFDIEVNDISNKVISGEIQKLYPEVEALTPELFLNFRLDNTSVDNVLDKISEYGILSLDNIDKTILKKSV